MAKQTWHVVGVNVWMGLLLCDMMKHGNVCFLLFYLVAIASWLHHALHAVQLDQYFCAFPAA